MFRTWLGGYGCSRLSLSARKDFFSKKKKKNEKKEEKEITLILELTINEKREIINIRIGTL